MNRTIGIVGNLFRGAILIPVATFGLWYPFASTVVKNKGEQSPANNSSVVASPLLHSHQASNEPKIDDMEMKGN